VPTQAAGFHAFDAAIATAAAKIRSNQCHRYLKGSWLTSMTRSCSISCTLRSDSKKRTYSITTSPIISRLVLKWRNGSGLV
jgi:hypothetical protein